MSKLYKGFMSNNAPGISRTLVTIPITGWTTATDSDGATYYTIDITVKGMTSKFEGLRDSDYVQPDPWNVAANESAKNNFSLIEGMFSHDGYFTINASAVPDHIFDIYIYGL